MLKVTGNRIQLTRGDTMILQVSLKDETGEDYIPVETDKIYFRVKKQASKAEILIEKEIPYDTLILQIDEDDTKDLKFDTYSYEIELVTEANYHFTVIADSEFKITTELENHG